METSKRELLARSLSLGDTIRFSLSTVMNDELKSAEEKRLFRQKLNARLEDLGFWVGEDSRQDSLGS